MTFTENTSLSVSSYFSQIFGPSLFNPDRFRVSSEFPRIISWSTLKKTEIVWYPAPLWLNHVIVWSEKHSPIKRSRSIWLRGGSPTICLAESYNWGPIENSVWRNYTRAPKPLHTLLSGGQCFFSVGLYCFYYAIPVYGTIEGDGSGWLLTY